MLKYLPPSFSPWFSSQPQCSRVHCLHQWVPHINYALSGENLTSTTCALGSHHVGRRWITSAIPSNIKHNNSDVLAISSIPSSSPSSLVSYRGLSLCVIFSIGHLQILTSALPFGGQGAMKTARPSEAALRNCLKLQQCFLFQPLRFHSAFNYLHLFELFQCTEQKYLLSCPQVISLNHPS